MEKKTESEKKTAVKKDYLVLNLQKPIEYGGTYISQLDLTGLREMTGRELNVIYDLYASQGGGGVALQESTLLFAQVVASRVCGYPLEAIMEPKAKDSVYLKNRVYRFFYLLELDVPET